jgi:hypothetical protein
MMHQPRLNPLNASDQKKKEISCRTYNGRDEGPLFSRVCATYPKGHDTSVAPKGLSSVSHDAVLHFAIFLLQ